MQPIASSPIRVVIVDDSRTMDAVLAPLLTTRLHYEIVGIAGDAHAAIPMIHRLRPDLVTIDLAMPYIDGAQLLAGLAALPLLRRVMISASACDNPAIKASLERAGADACLSRAAITRDPDGFCRMLAAVMRAPRPMRAGAPAAAAGPAASPPIRPPIPADEPERLAALAVLGLANADADQRLDLLTGHLVQTTAFAAAAITFIDRHRLWIKSACGLARGSVDRAEAICSYTICGDAPFVVADTACDPRLAGLGVVRSGPMIRAYAGCPIVAASGIRLGALCLLDTVPRHVAAPELTNLRSIARLTAGWIDAGPAAALRAA